MAVTTGFTLSISSGGSHGTALQVNVTGLSFVGIDEEYRETQVIGVAAPAQPACTPGTGGSMVSGNYLVKTTYVDAPQGESLPSPESTSQTVASSGTLEVNSPAASGSAQFYNVYITAAGGASGTETLQNATPIPIGTNYTQSAAVSAGAALPVTNTTLTFAPDIPEKPAQVVYLRNVSPSSQVVSALWTKQGGTSQPVLDLVVNAAIAFLEPTAGAQQGGITALSLVASAPQIGRAHV